MDNLIAEANVELGTFEQRKPTKDEIQADKEFQAKCKIKDMERQSEIDAKLAARQAIADRLGLTADELQVLLG